MRIGILDDNDSERIIVKTYVQETLSEKNISGKIVEFSSGESLINYCDRKSEKIDLLFLDVEMPGLDGIEVKNIISDSNSVCRIVFVTSHNEAMPDAFGYKVVDFLVKPVERSAIERQIDKLLKQILQNKIIRIEDGVEIYLEDLKYIRSEGNYTLFYLKGSDDYKVTSRQMGIVESELSNLPIIRVHKSYMVNLLEVIEILSDKVILREDTNGQDKTIIPVGRKYAKAAKSGFIDFKKMQMRER